VLDRLDLSRLGEVKVKPETNEQLEKMIRSFMQEYLPIQSKTWALLEQIRKTWGSPSGECD
jgi:DNA repair protein RecO (recombination protein O)